MARQALVIDASVGVKWFSDINEFYVPQARAIMKAHASDEINLVVPDLFFHEIANALVFKKHLQTELIYESLTTLFELDLAVFPMNVEHLRSAVRISRTADITEYDACYVVAAIEKRCPLVTANPRHQRQEMGCRVIPIDKWSLKV
jgi:predicted nucleic acid-binding protein